MNQMLQIFLAWALVVSFVFAPRVALQYALRKTGI
jgi:hypothetical protein